MWKQYLTTFLVESWKQLLPREQLEHSMSNCQACCWNHAKLQTAFPALPRYTAPSSIVHLPHCEESVADTTRKVLAELNKTYEEAFGQSFMEAAVQYCGCSEGTDKQKSKQEKKKEVRAMQRKFRDSVNEQYASTATITFLAENESVCGNQRKRLSQFLLTSARGWSS